MKLDTKGNRFFITGLWFFIGCNNHVNEDIKVKNIPAYYCNCDSSQLNTFINFYRDHWPKEKPKSVPEAINLFELFANDQFRSVIVSCKQEDIYFNLGLKIRNEWVRNGDSSLNNQLMERLNINQIDQTSSFILYVYKQYLLDSISNLSDKLLKANSADTVKSELKSIQNELIRMRNKN